VLARLKLNSPDLIPCFKQYTLLIGTRFACLLFEGACFLKISGFSFCRNAQSLYYPLVESIRSILPICDEFVIAVGEGYPGDRTREAILEIGDPKIRIIDTEWTDRERLRGWVHSQQTNIALNECTGDWCFYLQSDEVVHEKDLPVIKARCAQLLDDRDVDGLLFRFKHFWGDYDHCHISHAWYPHEIRIVRNKAGIQSWRSAQSFRRDGAILRVSKVDADIYHYGWVRPPRMMQTKCRELVTTHEGRQVADSRYGDGLFSYGSLDNVPRFEGTHPAVMKDMMRRFDWGAELLQTGYPREPMRHEMPKYRLLTFIEQNIFGGRIQLGKKGYTLLQR
jgi:hypothetical protein